MTVCTFSLVIMLTFVGLKLLIMLRLARLNVQLLMVMLRLARKVRSSIGILGPGSTILLFTVPLLLAGGVSLLKSSLRILVTLSVSGIIVLVVVKSILFVVVLRVPGILDRGHQCFYISRGGTANVHDVFHVETMQYRHEDLMHPTMNALYLIVDIEIGTIVGHRLEERGFIDVHL